MLLTAVRSHHRPTTWRAPTTKRRTARYGRTKRDQSKSPTVHHPSVETPSRMYAGWSWAERRVHEADEGERLFGEYFSRKKTDENINKKRDIDFFTLLKYLLFDVLLLLASDIFHVTFLFTGGLPQNRKGFENRSYEAAGSVLKPITEPATLTNDEWEFGGRDTPQGK